MCVIALVHLALEIEQPQCTQLNHSTCLQIISHDNWQYFQFLYTLCNPVCNSALTQHKHFSLISQFQT